MKNPFDPFSASTFPETIVASRPVTKGLCPATTILTLMDERPSSRQGPTHPDHGPNDQGAKGGTLHTITPRATHVATLGAKAHLDRDRTKASNNGRLTHGQWAMKRPNDLLYSRHSINNRTTIKQPLGVISLIINEAVIHARLEGYQWPGAVSNVNISSR